MNYLLNRSSSCKILPKLHNYLTVSNLISLNILGTQFLPSVSGHLQSKRLRLAERKLLSSHQVSN